jgi:Transmembrane domain of unknown function (DUF3566)
LDRLTNKPDGSGGASPTVTASWQDDDLMADHDQDTQPADLMTPPARTTRTPAAARSAFAGQDASANGGPAAEDSGKAGPGDTDPAAAAAGAAPALPADTIRPARDPSAFTFTRSAPVSPGAGERAASDPGDVPAVETPAAAEPDTESPINRAGFRPAPATDPAAGSLPADAPPGPEPSAPPVSAAAFAWETPEPAPTSPSSPARAFLRSGVDTEASAAPSAPAATVEPAAAAVGGSAGPARSTQKKRSAQRQARQAHLTVARIEPWSVMKFSFVLSLVAFVILFVAVTVLYGTLSALGVFESLQRVVTSVTSSQDSAGVNAAKWFTASRVLGYTGLLGSLNIVLITAMATIGAVVYNLTSRLIGGVEVTLRETD